MTVLGIALFAFAAPAQADGERGVMQDDPSEADAQFELGQAYRLGRGVEQDAAQGELLIAEAAAHGHAPAIDTYALLLFQDGRRAQAIPYLEASARGGSPRAQYLLGIGHFNGDFLVKDWVRAYALMSLSSAGGFAPADEGLAQMDRHLSPNQSQSALLLAEQMIEAGGESMVPVPTSMAKDTAVANRSETSAGSWRLQLGTFSVPENADRLWASLSDEPILAGKTKRVVSSGRLAILQVGNFASLGDAQNACKVLQRGPQDCLAIR